jgi:hypothetical protein
MMPGDVERFIKIQRREDTGWRTIPMGERVKVWEKTQAEADDGSLRILFHIGYVGGLSRGQRVTYLGQAFTLLEVSDSKRLVGLELRCAATAD